MDAISMHQVQAIAVVGVGDLGKFVCEELMKDSRYRVIVISRRPTHQWAEQRGIPSYCCPTYSEDSVLQALDETEAVALVSFVNVMEEYFNIHHALARACLRSRKCRRFIPSEWAGNLDEFAMLPRAFGVTRHSFREQLLQMTELESTLVCPGWLMDYLAMPSCTYMSPIGDWHVIDVSRWEVCIRGTGDEQHSLTSARDVGRAICSLLAAPSWEPITYITAEWMTYNELVCLVEEFYHKKFVVKASKSVETIYKTLEQKQHLLHTDQNEWVKASLDEWMITGAAACPKYKTMQQKKKYFSNLTFSTVKQFLQQTEEKDFV